MFGKIQIILIMKTTISNNRISRLNKVTSPLTFFYVSSYLQITTFGWKRDCALNKAILESRYKICKDDKKTTTLKRIVHFSPAVQFLSTTMVIIFWKVILWCFSKFFFHRKWNEAWLLVINKVYMRYITTFPKS